MGDFRKAYLKSKEGALEIMIKQAMGFAEKHKGKEIILTGHETTANGEKSNRYSLFKYLNPGEANAEEYGFHHHTICHCADCDSRDATGITYDLDVFRIAKENEKIKFNEVIKKVKGKELNFWSWRYMLNKTEKRDSLISVYADFQTNFRNYEYAIASRIDGIEVPLNSAKSIVSLLVDGFVERL